MIGPAEISAVLRLTDDLGIHREAVRIPLSGSAAGDVRIEEGRLLVLLPEAGDFSRFAASLPGRIRALPGFALLRRSEDAS